MRRDTARAIILTEDEKFVYLLYRKKKEKGKLLTYYAIPGGMIENQETVEEAVIREIQEEFSVDIKLLGYLGSNKTNHGIDYHYHAKIVNGTPILGREEKEQNTEENYYEIKKVPLSDLSKDNINILPINISYIEKALKKEYKII